MADKVSDKSLSDLVTGDAPKYDVALTVGGDRKAAEAPPTDGATVLKNIRAKYPKYSDLSDQALASAIVKKYPDYHDVLGDIASPPNLVQRGYRAVKGAVAKPFELAGNFDVAVSKMPEGPLKQFLGGGGRMLHSETPEQAKKGAAWSSDIATPMLLTAPMSVIGGAAGAGLSAAKGVLPRLLPAAGRIAGSAAGGGAVAAGEGKSIPEGVGWGAAGGTLGEGVGIGLTRGAQAIPGLVRRAEGSRIGKAMTQLFPELKATTSKELSEVAADGKTLIDTWFNEQKSEIGKALKAKGITAIKVPQLSDKPLTLQQAIDEWSNLRGSAKFDARAALVARLEQVAPGAGKLLDEALAHRSSQLTYLSVLKHAIDPKTGEVDSRRMMEFGNKHIAAVRRGFGKNAPEAERTIFRGQQYPAKVDRPASTIRHPFAAILEQARGRFRGPQPPLSIPAQQQALIDAALAGSPEATKVLGALGLLAGQGALSLGGHTYHRGLDVLGHGE